jgi:hypothetical protein
MENRDNVVSIGQARPQCPFGKFHYPHQVVSDPTLRPDEKRAILAAWASDQHAVGSLPLLRHLPGTPFPVTFSSIMNARLALDKMTGANDDDPPPRPSAIRRRHPRALTGGESMKSELVLAIDRKGRLTMARWEKR